MSFHPLIWPSFNPVALQVGPLAVRWYGLAYVVALVIGLWAVKRLARLCPLPGLSPDESANLMDDAFIWIALGVILGGRLGYILFYGLPHYLQSPLDALQVWHGGMSFHGGLLGVIIAMALFCRSKNINVVNLSDRVATVVPIGLGLGRIANFINGELWGRPVTHPENVPWAMIFPQVDFLPRHPSQLYEAGLEGLLLTIALWLTVRHGISKWLPSGVFLTGYALSRIFAEIFRVPEITHNVFGLFFISQGQLLSLPMLAFGLFLMYLGCCEPQPTATKSKRSRAKHAA